MDRATRLELGAGNREIRVVFDEVVAMLASIWSVERNGSGDLTWGKIWQSRQARRVLQSRQPE